MQEESAIDLVYKMASNGDAEAISFLTLWGGLWLESIAFLSGEKHDPQKFIRILANANIVYSCPFFTKHAARLHLVAVGIANNVVDRWAKKENYLEPLVEMIIAVAMIEGGFKLVRQVSPLAREVALRSFDVD